MGIDLGRVGIWSRELRFNADRGARTAAAGELEELGYSALFIPDVGGDVFGAAAELLAATRAVPLATGILNIWAHDPAEVARGHAGLTARFGPRFLLGLGAGHGQFVESVLGVPYTRPYATMVAYLDALDAAEVPVPPAQRMLAALGPRMLALAGARAAAAHPYLVPPEHTAAARQALGPGPLLAPQQAVVLDADLARARERARDFVGGYLALPNYTSNLRRLGFTDDDLRGPASDRLTDALVAQGDEAAVAARVREHLDAGADHVCLYVLGGGPGDALPLDGWRRLAPAVTGL
jgi:probable F420-dependent oxidoreductase